VAARAAQRRPGRAAIGLADGIFIAEYEQRDIGDVLFRVACNMGLEGIVSKRSIMASAPPGASTG
jgi:ATP-dependent DNA ligase